MQNQRNSQKYSRLYNNNNNTVSLTLHLLHNKGSTYYPTTLLLICPFFTSPFLSTHTLPSPIISPLLPSPLLLTPHSYPPLSYHLTTPTFPSSINSPLLLTPHSYPPLSCQLPTPTMSPLHDITTTHLGSPLITPSSPPQPFNYTLLQR